MHGRRPLHEKKLCRLYFRDPATVTPAKPYTKKEFFIMETYIADLHTSLYFPEIQNIAFKLPHVCILGNNHCRNTRRESFKHSSTTQDVMCCCYYSLLLMWMLSKGIILSWIKGLDTWNLEVFLWWIGSFRNGDLITKLLICPLSGVKFDDIF